MCELYLIIGWDGKSEPPASSAAVPDGAGQPDTMDADSQTE